MKLITRALLALFLFAAIVAAAVAWWLQRPLPLSTTPVEV